MPTLKGCKVKGDWYCAAFCIPLAAGGLLIFSSMMIFALWQILFTTTASSPPLNDWASVSHLIFASNLLFFSTLGLLAVLLRHRLLNDKIAVIWGITWIFWVGSFVVLLVLTSIRIAEKWSFPSAEILRICVDCSVYVILLSAAWWEYNVLASLEKVYHMDGNGWEFKNHRELLLMKILLQSAGLPASFDMYKHSELPESSTLSVGML